MTDFNRIYLNPISRGCAVVGAALAQIGCDASSDDPCEITLMTGKR